MGGRIGHLAESPLPSREPLPVDLELQEEVWCHQGAPDSRVRGPRGKAVWGPDRQEHADDPWGEEEVDPHGVEPLPSDSLEVEYALEEVSDRDEEEDGQGQEPEGEIDVMGDVEELGGGARGERPPEDGLAAEAKADAKASDGEPEEERPGFVLWEKDVFVVLHV